MPYVHSNRWYNHLIANEDGSEIEVRDGIYQIDTSKAVCLESRQGIQGINGVLGRESASPKAFLVFSVSPHGNLRLIRGDDWIREFGGKQLQKRLEE